jgi:hypothetical protein
VYVILYKITFLLTYLFTMKGNIMDKKILLGGAAALMLVGNMYATPANAAIDLSISGEAEVSAIMGDVCSNGNAANDTAEVSLGVDGIAAITALNTDIAITEATSDNVAATADTTISYDDNGCGSANEDNPVLGTDAKFEIAASGTLANGLSIDYSNSAALDDYAITFGGAFGSLTVKPGVSAIDEAMVGDTSGADVTGNDMGGHVLATDGSAGNALLYTAPSMGSLDFMLSYAPNSEDSGLDDSEYADTFGIAAVFNADMITMSAGFENASSDETCGPVDYEFADGTTTYTASGAQTGLTIVAQAALTIQADDASGNTGGTDQAAGAVAAQAAGATATIAASTAAVEMTADDLFDIVYGRDLCGDQSLVAVGAEMSAGDFTLSAAYSAIDTDEADRTTTSVGIGTSLGDYSLAAGWANTVHEYQASLEDEQTVLDVTLETALGDGVDLALTFSQNDMSKASQANGGEGDTNNYRAGMTVTVGF